MNIRAKLLLVFVVLGVVPMLLLGIGYYRSGGHAIEQLLRADVEYRAARAENELRTALADREASLSELAHAPGLRRYMNAAKTNQSTDGADEDVRTLLKGFVRSHT